MMAMSLRESEKRRFSRDRDMEQSGVMSLDPSIELHPRTEGCVMVVKAQPAARQDRIIGIHHGILKISVTSVPDKGKANKAIVRILSEKLTVKRSQIEIVNGKKSAKKSILFRGFTCQQISALIQNCLSVESG